MLKPEWTGDLDDWLTRRRRDPRPGTHLPEIAEVERLVNARNRHANVVAKYAQEFMAYVDGHDITEHTRKLHQPYQVCWMHLNRALRELAELNELISLTTEVEQPA